MQPPKKITYVLVMRLTFSRKGTTAVGQVDNVFALHTVTRGLIPGNDRPKSLIKTGNHSSLLNARQKVWISRILGDEHYKGLTVLRCVLHIEPSMFNGMSADIHFSQ